VRLANQEAREKAKLARALKQVTASTTPTTSAPALTPPAKKARVSRIDRAPNDSGSRAKSKPPPKANEKKKKKKKKPPAQKGAQD
jgi:hypothetical protein